MSPQVWLVTGASNGIGLSMTEYLLENGHNVVAAVRKPESMQAHVDRYTSSRILPVRVNVQSQADVKEAFMKAKDIFGRIDVVFNNAGYSAVGEVEGVPLEDARDMFETNFWGATYVSLEAVKFFRETNKPIGGRLIQSSSIFGVVALGANGYYSASKFALEGISESIAKELDPAWNIKITLADLGYFRTNFVKNHTYSVYSHPSYEANPNLVGSQTRAVLANVDPTVIKGSPDKLAKRIFEVSVLEDPPLRILLGAEAPAILGPKLEADEKEREMYKDWANGLSFDE